MCLLIRALHLPSPNSRINATSTHLYFLIIELLAVISHVYLLRLDSLNICMLFGLAAS